MGEELSRRSLLQSGLAGAGVILTGKSFRVVAGPFEQDDFPVPKDKKLDARWVAALTERKARTTYTKSAGELDHIGMPVGGIGAGQVYLGGDGTLWHWDVFNLPAKDEWKNSSGGHYAKPAAPRSPFEIGFALRLGGAEPRALSAAGWAEVTFTGEYPIGFVRYRDPACSVAVDLEAFSPFVPGDADASSHPATCMNYTVFNSGEEAVEVEILATVENPVCIRSGTAGRGVRRARHLAGDDATILAFDAVSAKPVQSRPARPEICFEDFESASYAKWTVTGTAFGTGPMQKASMPKYQGDVGAHGERLVNSHETRNGEDVRAGDAHVGSLLSEAFTIARRYVSFRIGGGAHVDKTCIQLLVAGTVVRTASGHNDNKMRWCSWDVQEFQDRQARLRIVDAETGAWGNIGIDEIVFGDEPREVVPALTEELDFGTFALGYRGRATTPGLEPGTGQTTLFGSRQVLALGAKQRIQPRSAATFAFVVAWHFPRVDPALFSHLPNPAALRRWYATRFQDAVAVAQSLLADPARLEAATREFHATWYDSTLPHWLLDRALCNVSTLATSTYWRFADGRAYGWEGNYCCPGTCTHVWNYAQAVACLFPELERRQREHIDFGLAFDAATGVIWYRAEASKELAVDGQAGTILRAWREHLRSPDDSFLRRIWPRCKRAMECLIARDRDADGILDGAQYNTLDTAWWGEIAWISSLYVAALRASEAMANVVGDRPFAERCRTLASSGTTALSARLFDGEYFVQKLDPAHGEANATGAGCHIDQLLGESWARLLGLPRVVAQEHARSALQSLWRYNFALDIGPYRAKFDKVIRGGRWYAMPGEGGLLMCTWPKKGIEKAAGASNDAWAAGYFNECMSGFEWQVATHMLHEGMVVEGLAVARTIHDRYHAKKRNPFNEVECGDHYARAMASYGILLAVTGFEHDGPAGHIGFAPRLPGDDFRAPFTACEGHGTYEQKQGKQGLECVVRVRSGRLRLRTIGIAGALGPARPLRGVMLLREPAASEPLGARIEESPGRLLVRLANEVVIAAGQAVAVTFG